MDNKDRVSIPNRIWSNQEMYDHMYAMRRKTKKTYEEFVESLDWDDQGRALLSGYYLSLIGNSSPFFYNDADTHIYDDYMKRMVSEGYIIQTLDVSRNVFQIRNNRYIYKPEAKIRAWFDRNPFWYLYVWGCLLILGTGLFLYHIASNIPS